MKLTSAQRKYLESQANGLDPIIRIGKQGLESNFALSLNEAFNSHELIKIKLLDTAPTDARETADKAIELSKAQLVRIIGHTVILYKPFEDKPTRISFPN